MHAAQSPFPRIKRDATLYQLRDQPFRFEFLSAPCARKKTTLVKPGLNVNLENSGYTCLTKIHAGLLSFTDPPWPIEGGSPLSS